MIFLVDSHCHLDRLDLTKLSGSLDAVLSAARSRGVGYFLCAGISLDNAETVRSLARRYPDVGCGVGVHPLDLKQALPDSGRLLAELEHPEVIAVGETGLDYHYSAGTKALQQESFDLHLNAARQTGKPVIVHSREAREDTLRQLKNADLPQAGVLHCFTEDWAMARAALDMGFYISLSGIVTFANAVELRDIAGKIPADRLLLETDSPYLAPVPYRGKTNQPAYVREVAECVAQLRNTSLEELAVQTTRNFHRLFLPTQSPPL